MALYKCAYYQALILLVYLAVYIQSKEGKQGSHKLDSLQKKVDRMKVRVVLKLFLSDGENCGAISAYLDSTDQVFVTLNLNMHKYS